MTGDTLNKSQSIEDTAGRNGRAADSRHDERAIGGDGERSAATVNADNNFEGKAVVAAGNNTVTVMATDTNGNTTTNNYNVVVTGSGSKTLINDPNGNLTSGKSV